MAFKKIWLALIIASIALLFGCEDQVNPIDKPTPTDEDPAIAITSPTNPRFSGRVGDAKSLTLQMADNESLSKFTINASYFLPDGTLDSSTQISTQDITGKTFSFSFSFTVDNRAPFSKIEYTFTVEDSKGATASTKATVSVLPEPGDPPPYQILTYTGDSIMNQLGDSLFGFNLSSRQGYPKTTGQSLDSLNLRLDIIESSGTGQGLWQPTLRSPNNEAIGVDSVFVITDSSRLNYEQATYNSIFEAFFSADLQMDETPVLEEGMYVIVRLVKAPRPQFALMRITEVFNDGAGINVFDKVYFDYKVSTP
ncbi:MAG: hypothetical protein MRZ79_10755 [Bacteroidia bacterium]|nr:hypothetical protein [Bacteroidia bacterium]